MSAEVNRSTGDPRVDEAIALLPDLRSNGAGEAVPGAAEHVACYADVHRRLQDVLDAPVDQQAAMPASRSQPLERLPR